MFAAATPEPCAQEGDVASKRRALRHNISFSDGDSADSFIDEAASVAVHLAAAREEWLQEARARARALTQTLRQSEGGFLDFIVGTDGSPGAHLAFLGACALRRGAGNVHVWHVCDPAVAQSSLRFDCQHANIQRRYEAELAPRVASGSHTFRVIEKPRAATVKSTICGAVDALESKMVSGGGVARGAFFVCGVVPRGASGGSPSVLGSCADLTLRAVRLPVVLVQRAPRGGDTPREWLVLIGRAPDDARDALAVVAQLARRGDALEMLCVRDPADDAESLSLANFDDRRARLEEDIAATAPGVATKFTVAPRDGTRTVPTQLCGFVREREPDFVVMIPRADQGLIEHGAHSVTEQVVRDCSNTNFILIKH